MSAEYALFKNPNPNKDDEKTTLHARIVGGTVVDTEHIIEELKEASSFSPGDIKGLLQSLADSLVFHLKQGDEVDLEGIGHFSVSLSCSKKVTSPKEIRADDIHFKSVNFRCSKKISQRLKGMELKRRANTSIDPSYDPETRLANIRKYLETHDSIMSSQCMSINACSRYTALKDIETLIQAGVLKKIGRRKTAIYILSE